MIEAAKVREIRILFIPMEGAGIIITTYIL